MLNVTEVVATVSAIHDQSEYIRYLIALGVLFFSYLLSRFAGRIAKSYGKRIAEHTATNVDDELLRISIKPLRVAIIIMGFLTALFVSGWDADSIRLLAKPMGAFAILILARILVHVIAVLIEEYGTHLAQLADTTLDKRFIPTIQGIISFVIYLVAGLMTLSTLGVDITPLVTLGGIAGLAVAVASQDTLGNLVAGIIVMYDKPFATGDRVLIGGAESGESGEVLAVGIFSTKIRNWDNNVITYPNSELYKKGALNYSLGDQRVRVRIPVGVAYGSDVEKVRTILVQIAEEDEGVLDQPAPRALFLSFGDFAYEFELRVYIRDLVDIFDTRDRINTRIKERFDEEGVEIPFPVRTLHVNRKDVL